MKKLLAVLLAMAMVLCLFACDQTKPQPDGTDAVPTGTTTPNATNPPVSSIEKGTVWESVAGYHTQEDPESVWQYYFYDPSDATYNPMMAFIDHEDEDIHSWYPWEGSWVGVGFNNGEFCNEYGLALEQNADGPTGMISVIGFTAPADGEYVITGKLMNAFDQDAGPYSVLKADGTVLIQEDYRDYIKGGYTFLTPTKVTLKAGEEIYFQPSSTNGWVSAYSELAVYYEPTDESVLVKPESFMPVPDYPDIELGMTAAEYNAREELNTTSATEGPWVYAITTDGVEFTPLAEYIEREWDDDPEPDACEWYMSNDDYVGIGINADVEGYLEANISDSFENGGSAAALGFKAPKDGTYSFTVFTENVFGQNADKVVASLNGETAAEFLFNEYGNVQILDLELKAGETVYFHGVSNGGWVSAYFAVYVNAYSAVAQFSGTMDGNWVYAITSDGKEFTPQAVYLEREWDDDPEPDAYQWYMSEDDYVGIGINADMAGYLEANISNSFENSGSAAALGFRAPEAGKYEITVVSLNAWGQNGGDVVVSLNGETVGTTPFLDVPYGRTFTLELNAGDVVYVHGTSNGDWVSAYLQVAANRVG